MLRTPVQQLYRSFFILKKYLNDKVTKCQSNKVTKYPSIKVTERQ